MYTKEDDAMNLDVCMRFECKNCKRRLKCFKEEVDYSLNNKEYEVTDSMKKPDTAMCFTSVYQTTLGHQMLEGKSFEDFMIEEYSKKEKIYNEIFGKEK